MIDHVHNRQHSLPRIANITFAKWKDCRTKLEKPSTQFLSLKLDSEFLGEILKLDENLYKLLWKWSESFANPETEWDLN